MSNSEPDSRRVVPKPWEVLDTGSKVSMRREIVTAQLSDSTQEQCASPWKTAESRFLNKYVQN
jgi:hypothetical protein